MAEHLCVMVKETMTYHKGGVPMAHKMEKQQCHIIPPPPCLSYAKVRN